MSRRAPSIFICYRRADEPFAAALTASILEDSVGADEIFLDTLYLRQRGPFERALLEAVRNCTTVLAIVGPAWDNPTNLARLAEPTDWVRRELVEAFESGTPIVPVLVGRNTVPAIPGLMFDRRCLVIDPNDPERLEGDLCNLLEIRCSAGRDMRERVERAALALLRHVLPRPQRSMDNDLTVARCVASELKRGEWLRFVTTGNLPSKPNGSAVVYVTREVVGVAQLTEDLASRPVIRLPLKDLAIRRTDGHLLWRRVTDLDLMSDSRTVHVEGIFGEEADEFLELTAS
jgi:TIR domain